MVDLKYCEPPTTISDHHGSKTNRLTAHIINNPYTTIRLTFTVYSQHVSTATDAVVRAFMFPQDELLIILMFFPLMPSSGQNFYLSNTLIYEQITTKLVTLYTL